VRVRVRINVTPTYPAFLADSSRGKGAVRERSPDFWRDFKVEVTQGRAITPKKLYSRPIYTSAFQAPRPLGGALQGAEVQLEFGSAQIASEPLRIKVLTPDRQTTETEFDLRDLR
jgi:hypothetical protein